MVSRIGLLQPPKISLLKYPEPATKVPAIGEDFTDTVKCRPQEGRLSWIVSVVHGITDSSHEAGRPESDRKREAEPERLQDAMLDHALLADALQGQRSSGNRSQGGSSALGSN